MAALTFRLYARPLSSSTTICFTPLRSFLSHQKVTTSYSLQKTAYPVFAETQTFSSLKNRHVRFMSSDAANSNMFNFWKALGVVCFVQICAGCFLTCYGSEVESSIKKTLNRKEGNFFEVRAVKDEEIKVAFLNFRMQWITDTPTYPTYDPKYRWCKRVFPILQLIQKDSPDVLGFCEVNCLQIQDLYTKLSGYTVFGYNVETGKNLEEYVTADSLAGIDPKQEFVGLILKKSRFEIENIKLHPLKEPSAKDPQYGKRNRLLVEFHVKDRINQSKLIVLVTHFDHKSIEWRKSAGEYELALTKKIESQGIPWFSLGDRNWFPDAGGEACYQEYRKKEYICDFRDENLEKHSGPYGSFPGHLHDHYLPKIIKPHEEDPRSMVDAAMLDACFRSRTKVQGVCSYAYAGEFNPDNYLLRSNDDQGDLSERNFVSDHYYVGGIFKIKK